MNRAYNLNIVYSKDNDNITGSVNNIGYWAGQKASWQDQTHRIVKLDIATEPDMIDINGARLYRYPKLSLPRIKVDGLKDKYNIKVVRDQHKADYGIVSNKLIDSLFTDSWDSYYQKDELSTFIEMLKPYVGKIVTTDVIDKLGSLYDKLGDMDRLTIKLPHAWDTSDDYGEWSNKWNDHRRKQPSGGYSIVLPNENVNTFQELSKSKLILDKCLNRICNEDAHVITEDEVETTLQMLRSDDHEARAMGLEMLANCNIEECFDKVAYMWHWTFDYLRYASNWNTVNVKALRERMYDVNPHNQNHSIHAWNHLVQQLIKEQSFTEWVWLKIRSDIHENMINRVGFNAKSTYGSNTPGIFDIKLEAIELKDTYLNSVIVKPSGEEILEEITKPDGFDDLPF